MGFDTTSLHHAAGWDKNSVYPKIKSGLVFKSYMNDVFVDAFIDETFNQDGNGSAVLKKLLQSS